MCTTRPSSFTRAVGARPSRKYSCWDRPEARLKPTGTPLSSPPGRRCASPRKIRNRSLLGDPPACTCDPAADGSWRRSSGPASGRVNRLRPHHSALDLHAIVSSDGVFTSGDLHADLERVAPTARPVTEARLRATHSPARVFKIDSTLRVTPGDGGKGHDTPLGRG